MFGGDVNSVWVSLHKLKAQCLHFMKIVWQFKVDATCLPKMLHMLIQQTKKTKERLGFVMENGDINKLLKKGISTIASFVEIKKNNDIDEFFKVNGYKVFF